MFGAQLRQVVRHALVAAPELLMLQQQLGLVVRQACHTLLQLFHLSQLALTRATRGIPVGLAPADLARAPQLSQLK